MKRAFNRAIAMLLVLFIVFPMLPVSVLAEQSTTLQGVGSVHTVTFESDQPASYLVADGKSIETMPEAPEKTAADFIGWYDGETEITAPFTPQADMTIVPKYDAWDARTLDAQVDGATVTLSGVMPSDVSLTVTDHLAEQPVQLLKIAPKKSAGTAAAPLSVDEKVSLYSLDIGMQKNDATEYQPDAETPVRVTMSGEKIASAVSEGRALNVTHTLDDGTAEQIADLTVQGETVSFSVTHFSTFDVDAVWNMTSVDTELMDGVSLSGTMPSGVRANAAPAEVEDALMAAELSFTNYDHDVQPAAWGGSMMVTMHSDAIAQAVHSGAEMKALRVSGDAAEELDIAVHEDGSVSFAADAHSVYAVTATTLKQTVTTSDGATYDIEVTYTTAAGIPMEGTALRVEEVLPSDAAYASYLDASASKLGTDTDHIELSRMFDIHIVDAQDASKVYEPAGSVDVSIRLVGSSLDQYANVSVLHFAGTDAAEAKTAQGEKNLPDEIHPVVSDETVKFTTGSFSVFVVAGYTLEKTIEASDGNTYRITVEYDENCGIPEGADLVVTEVAAENYAAYLTSAAQALGEDVHSVSYGKLFDISIEKDGVTYQPNEDVRVKVELLDAGESHDIRVVHFDDAHIPKSVAASVEGQAVTFETDGFSVFSFLDFSLLDHIVTAVLGEKTGTLYENDDIILSGSMPATGIVEAKQADITVEDATVLVAYDIKIYAGPTMKALGINWQPSGDSVRVQIKSDALVGRYADIYHVGEGSNVPELVSETVEIENHAVVFDADSFSIYAVSTAPRKTFYFFNDKDMSSPYEFKLDNSTVMTNRQIVKDGEALVMPQLPEREGLTFIGWFNCATEEQQAFGEPIPVSADETINLYARFGHVAYVTFRGAKDSGNWPIIFTRSAELENGSAEVMISDVQATPLDETHVFLGWTYSQADAEDPLNTDFITDSTITVTGDTDLYPVFAAAQWVRFSSGEAGNGASYKAPQYQLTNTTDSRFEVITRTGYTFTGWYASADAHLNGIGTQVTDANGNVIPNLRIDGARSDASGNLTLEDNITLYAGWVPNANTKYTVVYWLQRITDEPGLPDSEKTYYYYKADTNRTAATGSTVTLAAGDKVSSQVGGTGTEYVFNTVNSSPSSGVTVEADGSTVLNAYFDLAQSTLTFQVQQGNRWTTIFTVTGLYGQSVAYVFNEEPLKSYSEQGYYWSDYTGQVYSEILSTIELFPSKNITFHGDTRGNLRTIYYYVESLDQTSGVSNTRRIFPINGTNLYFDLYKTVTHSFNFLTYNEEYHPIDGFEMNRRYAEPYFGEPGRSASSNTMITNNDRAPIGGRTTQRTTTPNVNYLYYVRESNPLTLRNGYNNQEISSQSYKFEAVLSDPGTPDISYAPMQDAGYYFKGWYADQACSTRVFFTQEEAEQKKDETLDDNGNYHYVVINTMPSQPLTLFAGWDQQKFEVTINPDGGVLTETESTYFNTAYGEPILQYSDVTRNYVEREEGDSHPDSEIYYYYYDTKALNNATGNTTRKAYYYPKSEGVKPQTRLDDDGHPVEYIYNPGSYTLVGWYRVVNGKLDLYDFSTKVTEKTDLQAVWRKSGIWYVKYDAENAYQGRGTGTILGENGAPVSVVQLNTEYADGAMVVLEKAAEPAVGSEWQFVGWHIKGDETDTIYYPNEGMIYRSAFADHNNVLTLEAVYEKLQKTSITYDANGGSGTLTDGGSVVVGENVTPLTVTNNTVDQIEINSEVILSSGEGFVRDGYHLIGWSTSPARTANDFSPSANPSTDFVTDGQTHYVVDDPNGNVLYAVWERCYSITYRPNGGSGALEGLTPNGDGSYSETDILKSESATITSEEYIRPGYRFIGWNTAADGSGTVYSAGQEIGQMTDDLILYAQWEKLLHVIYDVNGGTGTLTNPNGLISNGQGQYNTGDIYTRNVTQVELSNGNSIERNGYMLNGWNTEPDGTGTHYDCGETTVLSDDLILYAEWVELHNLTYHANGGSGTLTDGGSYTYDEETINLENANAYANIPHGAEVKLSVGEGFTRSGYQLVGWNTSKSAADEEIVEYEKNDDLTLNEDTTLYAVWKKLLSVTYYLNGGEGVPAKADSHDLYRIGTDVFSTGDVYADATEVSVANAGTMEKEGYTFLGWSTDPGRTEEDFSDGNGTDFAPGSQLMIFNDTVLYAVWQKKLHINYDLNGGSGTLQDPEGLILEDNGQYTTGDIYEKGTDVSLSSGTSISYTGYTLTGWNTAADGSGTEYAIDGTLPDIQEDTTLYAQWSGTLYLKLVNETGENLSAIRVALPGGMSAEGIDNLSLTAGEEKVITITADKTVMDQIIAGTAGADEKQFTVSGTNKLGASYTLIVESEIGDAGVTARDTAENGSHYSVTDDLSVSAVATVTFTVERVRTLHFDVDGGTELPDAVFSSSDSSYTLPVTHKGGYRLVGWSTEDDNTKEYDAGQDVSLSELFPTGVYKKTLYAVWESLPLPILDSGLVRISKVVPEGGEQEKEFSFRISLSGTATAGSGSNAETYSFNNIAETVTLTSGQCIDIKTAYYPGKTGSGGCNSSGSVKANVKITYKKYDTNAVLVSSGTIVEWESENGALFTFRDCNITVTEIANGNDYTTTVSKYNTDGAVITVNSNQRTAVYTFANDNLPSGNVVFTNTYVPPTKNITIVKDARTFENDPLKTSENFTFHVTVNGASYKTFTISNRQGSNSYVLTDVPVGAVVTVTESGAEEYDTLMDVTEGSVVNGAPNVTNKTYTFTVGSSDATIKFTNTRKTASVLISKSVVNELLTDEERNSLVFAVQAKLTTSGGVPVSGYTVKNSNGDTVGKTDFNGQITFDIRHTAGKNLVLPVGAKLILTETGADDYTLTIVASGLEGNPTSGYSVDADGGTLSLTNTLKTATVTVTKTVLNGTPADAAASFDFSASLYNGSTPMTFGTFANGEMTFSLGTGESQVLTVPVGARLDVSETLNDPEKYTLSASGSRGVFSGNTYTVESVPLAGDRVTFSNTRNTVTVSVSKELVDPVATTAQSFGFTAILLENGEPIERCILSGIPNIVTDQNGSAAFSLNVDDGAIQTQTLTIPYGTELTVSETANALYDTSAVVTSGTYTSDSLEAAFSNLTENASVKFTNTRKTQTVYVEKSTVDPLDQNWSFSFEARVKNADGIGIAGIDTGTAGTTNSRGTVNFSLAHGMAAQSLTVPVGAGLEITELAADLYETEAEAKENGSIDGTLTGKTYSFTVPSSGTEDQRTVVFTNTRQYVPVTIEKTLTDAYSSEAADFLFDLQVRTGSADGDLINLPATWTIDGHESSLTSGGTTGKLSLSVTNGNTESQTVYLPAGTYITITEEENSRYQTYVTANGIETATNVAAIEPAAVGATYTYTFRNIRKTVPVTIMKVNEGGLALNGSTFTLEGTTASGTVSTNGSSTVFVGSLYYDGTYTLTEATAPAAYTGLSEPVELTVSETGTVMCTDPLVTVEFDEQSGRYTVKVKNVRNTHTVTVSKTLSDILAKSKQEFSFAVTLTEKDGTPIGGYTVYEDETNDVSVVTDSQGRAEFTLSASNGETVSDQLTVPEGSCLTVTENLTEEQIAVYDTTEDGGTFAADTLTASFTDIARDITAAFTNTRKTQRVYVSKKLEDPLAAEAVSFIFEASVYDTENELLNVYTTAYNMTGVQNFIEGFNNFSLEVNNEETVQVYMVVPVGSRLVVEEVLDAEQLNLYDTAVKLDNGIPESNTSCEIESVPVERSSTVAFTNTRKTRELSVAKTVTGDLRDYNREFAFTLSGLTPSGGYHTVMYEPVDGSYETVEADRYTDSEGAMHFTLRHGQKLVISIPAGIHVTIQEETSQFWETTIALDSGEDQAQENSSMDVYMDQDHLVAYSNDMPAVAPTEYRTRTVPYILLMIFGMAIVGLMFSKKKRQVSWNDL